MPITDPKNVHVNQPLTDLSIAHFDTEIVNYVGPRIAPLVRLRKLSDLYYLFDQGDLTRIVMALRASGAEADMGGYDLSTAAVTLERFALGKPTGNDEIGNQDEVLDLETADMNYLIMQWLMRMDERCAARLVAPLLWTGSFTGADLTPATVAGGLAWDNANATPVRDIHREVQSIKRRTLAKLNKQNFKLVLGERVWSALRENADIEAKFVGVQVGIVNEKMVAQACDIGEVIVADTMQNTGMEGAANVPTDMFTGNDALLLYVEPNPGKGKFSGAYTFVGGHRPELSPLGHWIKTYEDEKADAHVTEINAYFRHVQVSAMGGAYFDGIVT